MSAGERHTHSPPIRLSTPAAHFDLRRVWACVLQRSASTCEARLRDAERDVYIGRLHLERQRELIELSATARASYL